jgi:cardiolipin synthase
MPLVALPQIPNLPPPVRKYLRRPKPGSGDFTWDADEYVAGNRLALFVRGKDLFAAMIAAIDAAKETVSLETYRFGGDETGRAFAEALARASRRGARVRLIFDSVGSIELAPETETLMRNAGVQILEYHPVAPWRPRWAWNKRDHRKILVCDGRTGFTGGMNLCDEHAPREEGGLDWPDAHARVEGPAAHELERLFRAVWHKETGRWFDSEPRPALEPAPAAVRVVGNHEILKRFAIREAYVNALRAARREVSIANSYFIPDWRVRRSLAQAVRRGVDVRVLVPGRSDIRSVWYAMRATYGSLLTRGVRVFEWQGPMMHAKAVVVDGKWCAVGSYNLDHRSLQHNLEANLQTTDAPFAAALQAAFEAGVAGAVEITPYAWGRRSWAERALEQFFSSFDYFF